MMSDLERNPDLPTPNQGLGQTVAYVASGILTLLAFVTFLSVWTAGRQADRPPPPATHMVAAGDRATGGDQSSSNGSGVASSGTQGTPGSGSVASTSGNPTSSNTTGTGTGTVAGDSAIPSNETGGSNVGTTGSGVGSSTGGTVPTRATQLCRRGDHRRHRD